MLEFEDKGLRASPRTTRGAQRQTCLSDDADFERRLVLERKGLVLERHHDAGRRRDRVQACSDEDDDINTDDGQGMCKRC